MQDAPTLKLPSWPARVLSRYRGRQDAAKNDDTSGGGSSSSTEDVDADAKKSPDMFGSEPSYQRLPQPGAPVSRFRQRRVRWALCGAVAFGTVTIILLSTLLSRHAVDGLDTLFKVRFVYLFIYLID